MNTIVGTEIGTSKTVVLVADCSDRAEPVITGIGITPTIGVRKGGIIDMEYAVISAHSAIKAAEDNSTTDIDLVYMAVSGNGISCVGGSGSTPVTSPDGIITEEHANAAVEVAKAYPFSPEHFVLHSLNRMFRIDDSVEVLQPVGIMGSKLTADILLVYGIRNRLFNASSAVTQCNIGVENTYFGGLCSAAAVLTRQQKSAGTPVIDYGGGTTDHVVFADNAVQDIGSLEIGGDHITNDIAHAFKIPQLNAEDIKIMHGSTVIDSSATEEKIVIPPDVGFTGRTIIPASLRKVINARAAETLSIIRGRLIKNGLIDRLGAGVVLTGGCAKMTGIIPLAEEIFGMSCRIGLPLDISGPDVILDGPEFATCVGVLHNAARHTVIQSKESLWTRLGRVITRR